MKVVLILPLLFVKQCVTFSHIEYMTKLDSRVIIQLIHPYNYSDPAGLILAVEAYNMNFKHLIGKVQEHASEDIKRYVKALKTGRGPVFCQQFLVKDLFVRRSNWTEDEFARLRKSIKDTVNIREKFLKAYANNIEWIKKIVTPATNNTIIKLDWDDGTITELASVTRNIYAPNAPTRKTIEYIDESPEYNVTGYNLTEYNVTDVNVTLGPRFRMPPFKRGRPFSPPTFSIDRL